MEESRPGALRFGRYDLLYLLGEGGMAEIFLAEQLAAQDVRKLVVVKRMLPHLGRDPHYVAMFLDEARLASRLSHPNIVQIFDFGEIEGRYFLAMEYLAGENIGAIANQALATSHPLPLQAALQMIIGVCDGLHYAHEYSDGGRPMNIVHRDMSPSNAMVTYQGGVKVVDFGIARAADRQQERTKTGLVKGKLSYCAPEQFEGATIDRRADVFSVGVVFHELLTLSRLFRRDNEMQTIRAVLMEPIPSVRTTRPELPPALDDILARALSRDRSQRYPTALAFRRDLETLLQGPPVRLDEYMLKLFGEKRAQQRTEVGTSLSRITQLTDMTGAQLMTPASHADVMPGTDVIEVVPTPPPGTAMRSRRRWAARLTAAALAATFLGAGGWWLLRPRPGDATDKPAAGMAQLRIETSPPGATLSIDERPRDERSPTTLNDLAAGEHQVRADLAGYRPLARRVTLAAGARDTIALTLEPLPGIAKIQAPAGAQVELDGEPLGEVSQIEMTPGKHLVSITVAGQRPHRQRVTVAAGETVTITLPARAKGKAGSSPTKAAAEPPAKASAPGLLDVTCQPWCRVFLDGRDVGRPSPIVGLEIGAGQHELKLEHPPSGRSKEVVFTITAGQRLRQTAAFR